MLLCPMCAKLTRDCFCPRQVERLRLLMVAHAVEDAADAASGNKGSPSRGRRLHASEVIRPAAQGPLRDAATK